MRLIALALVCALSACASAFVANPNDPVDMTAELGNRARDYVGMGEACDATAGDGHRATIVQEVRAQQQQLGVLAELVNRAYRGHATPELTARVRADAQSCEGLAAQAQGDLSQRTMSILSMRPQLDLPDTVRQIQEPNS